LLSKNSKIPCTKHGQYDAKKGIQICKYKNNYNIGFVADKNNCIVLDCDFDIQRNLNGVETLKKLEYELGTLPDTLTQSTPRGGKHLIYKDTGIKNPIGKIGKDVDIKYRGYITIEPSSINGAKYKFTNGIDKNGNFIIAELPNSWLNYINKTKNNFYKTNDVNNNNYQRKIINGNFQKMYEKCAFIKHCVDNASVLDEISWFYFACVLNSLSNGESLFDLYSRPHKDYDPILVNKKFQNAKKYNVNCNTISRCFAECNFCVYNQGGNYAK